MKLLQLNMWGGRLEPQILKLVTSEDPDILCLQEAIDLKGGKGALFVTTEEIQEAIGAKYAYVSPNFSLRFMSRTANFSNCILSKFPIKHKETIFTGNQYIADFDWLNHSSNIRNLQRVAIKLPDGRELNVLNHHGYHNHQHKRGDEETMRQCGIIANKIKELKNPVILGGDFNLEPHSESLELINKLLRNLTIEAGLTTTRTPLTHKTEVCDYIFVSEDIKVTRFKAVEEIVSDHQALVLNFE
ncbi:MAG TPA: endonuclease/exonuclease/phosphatase family protein [Patescibacteria group bacterium]|nr:endonuclease/exonuclease/phosphatase family protein [Patescibacteria group bacterium]